MTRIFECVPNVSEGRDPEVLAACADAIVAAGATLAHRTSDVAHHRSVFTFFGERDVVLAAVVALARIVVARIDLRAHAGNHPRMGALDVLPFVPFGDATRADAIALARDAARALWDTCDVPSYYYGAVARDASRTLAAVRAGGFEGLGARADEPDVGRARSHPSAGATAVGVRDVLVAFNVVLASSDLALARRIARAMRERDGGLRTLRALGIAQDDGRVQVSFNVTDVRATPLDRIVAIVRSLAAHAGVAIAESELVGLVPRDALETVVRRHFDDPAAVEP